MEKTVNTLIDHGFLGTYTLLKGFQFHHGLLNEFLLEQFHSLQIIIGQLCPQGKVESPTEQRLALLVVVGRVPLGKAVLRV